MIADPPVRKNRRCARPGCDKPLTVQTARHRRYGGDAILAEPFCSTECCKAFHKVTITEGPGYTSAVGRSYLDEFREAESARKAARRGARAAA